MDDKKIQTVLQDALEDEIPSSEIHLWPGVQALVSGKSFHSQGEAPMNTPMKRRVSRVALALFAVSALVVLALVTPQGRSLAQEILQFFNRAESDSIPLEPSILTPGPDEITEDSKSSANANQTVSDVEAAVGFDVLEPTWLPNKYTFREANFDPTNNIVYLFYDYEIEGSGLVLSEAPLQTPDCEFCKLVGASADVETVQIGNIPGEFVEGVWKLNGTEAVWEPDPYLKTMRWQVDGMAFELLFMGPPDYVTKTDMIAIAESLAP